jgi:hypothetical protein
MTRTTCLHTLFAFALVAALDSGGALPGGDGPWFASPAHAQDDDGGDDDGGDDGGGDDDGGGGGVGVDDDGDDDDDSGRAERPRSDGGQAGAAPGPAQGRVANRGTRRMQPAPEAAPLPLRADGEIVVSGLTGADLAALQTEGFVVLETFSIVRNGPVLHRLRVPAGSSLEAGRDRVRARDSGRNADFNHYYRSGQAVTPAAAPPASVAAAAPADCVHLNCGFLDQIGWPAERSSGCRATVDIGVIDTSVNLDHAGLSATQVELLRVADPDLPSSGETHGTAVVALLAGSEARAPGLLPEARIVAVDIFSREGGDERADVAHLVQALDLLAQRGVRVANLSLAGPENTVLTDMLAAVAQSGMLVVAAAGNAGPAAAPSWPAAADTVLAVTAVDGGDRVYRRAQRGPHLDLAAPGVEVWSAASVKGVRPRTGTSYATPFATAAAALLMSRHPDMTPAVALSALRGLTRDVGAAGGDEVFGAGVLALDGLCGGVPE